MAVQWLPTEVNQTQTNGAGSTVTTSDATTRTTDHGEKTITRTTAALTRTNAKTETLVENAGGLVTFSVPIRGGLGVTGSAPVTPYIAS